MDEEEISRRIGDRRTLFHRCAVFMIATWMERMEDESNPCLLVFEGLVVDERKD